ncbi:TRI15-like protein [Metarhizium rileyi]|uniref:TRI15-like protein n=1 Tax=Metarhizium rileyi (strain RCEF 4871) TaxID=1649241 RepID=A0A167ENK9_METRR|nr:TRI15-like protein [Metarhizium rileyi RCEF 4871]
MDKRVFNCRTCNVEFGSSQAYRVHAKSDVHVANLKERVAASGVVLLSNVPRHDEEESHVSKPANKTKTNRSSSCTPTIENGKSNNEAVSAEDSDTERDETPDFVLDQCLFCGKLSGTFERNLEHMTQTHSFRVLEQQFLIVDVETLIWYLHLVIYGYSECLLCGKTRPSVEGIQQHMVAKSHCQFRLDDDIKDFYEFPEGMKSPEDMIISGESTMQLPSGKVLGQRAFSTESTSRRTAALSESQASKRSYGPISGSTSDLMTRNYRTLARLSTQLSQFRVGDQQSLAHLPAYELRSVLVSMKKQLSSSQREELRMRSRQEARGNKTLMKHFKPDVPGRLNG